MSVTVVIPWRAGCPHRDRALEWVVARYEERFPDWPVVIAPAPEGDWVKARAAMPAIAQVDTPLVLVADGDVWAEGLDDAADAVARGTSGWAMPHQRVCRLSLRATQQMVAGAAPAGLEMDELHQGVWGGGLVLLPKVVALSVPLDPRFVGWGGEDRAWALALDTLVGSCARGNAPLYHLWHPHQERRSRRRGRLESEQLLRRYFRARRKRKLMQALIDEVHDAAPHAAEQAVHDHPAVRVG